MGALHWALPALADGYWPDVCTFSEFTAPCCLIAAAVSKGFAMSESLNRELVRIAFSVASSPVKDKLSVRVRQISPARNFLFYYGSLGCPGRALLECEWRFN